ncbi:dCTP deaminase [Rhizobium phaseoli]|uniref:dCTP deaminase n=1 Tax=Rhizobium phaseoli TaxID=396 RepID=UPI000E2C44BD|nr:dCTP deaminase [Rhizobium phaseoli]RDJ18362.1 dCTP deaminase [Rhizobium phaseoli]RDJ19454.1 dCTP deaminase [Rhizobium phaseoli]
MEILDKNDIDALIKADDPNSLYIEPLLDPSQIGAVSVDLRLGYDFLVSIFSRKAFIGVDGDGHGARGPDRHFQATRRDIGERFILYPNQVVLATTLEYICLPSNVLGDIIVRSSYARLGIHLNTMLQPGYRGCASLELANHGNNPLELVVGSRLVQLRMYKIANEHGYLQGNPRKYYGDVRPTVSRFDRDPDLETLSKIAKVI